MVGLDDPNVRRKVLRLNRQGYATQTIARACDLGEFEVMQYLDRNNQSYWSRQGTGWRVDAIPDNPIPEPRLPEDPSPYEIAVRTAAIRRERQRSDGQDDIDCC